jgi:hypothetical protein
MYRTTVQPIKEWQDKLQIMALDWLHEAEEVMELKEFGKAWKGRAKALAGRKGLFKDLFGTVVHINFEQLLEEDADYIDI